MKTSIHPAITRVPSAFEPDLKRFDAQTVVHRAGNEPHTPRNPNGAQNDCKDPHGIRGFAPLVYAVYRVALELYPKLLNRTISDEDVLQRLRKLAPTSAFKFDYVAKQAFKLINPYGHGANSPRFRNETLAWFRQTYQEEAHLTDALILLVCAAMWWTHEEGYRSTIPHMSPLTTSDLDHKLKRFGFLAGERQAICRMLRRNRS